MYQSKYFEFKPYFHNLSHILIKYFHVFVLGLNSLIDLIIFFKVKEAEFQILKCVVKAFFFGGGGGGGGGSI
jgi:hypothetical protein